MKRLLKSLENIFAAAAFAEAGEFETARDILREEERTQKVNRILPVKRVQKRVNYGK